MFLRIGIFLCTNLAIIVVLSAVMSVFGIGSYVTSQGLNYQALFVFALVIGFTGSFISLFISKWLTKRTYGIHIIEQPNSDAEAWLQNKVKELSNQMKIGMPEVGIYESPEPNAFATGWNRNNALVAVSTGLLDHMDADEVEAVLGHEVAHVANGDMVTLALVQGVVNTFVVFFARIAAYFVTQFFSSDEEGEGFSGLVYFGVSIVFEILFGILASTIVMWFSRFREYRADASSAKYVGTEKMRRALQRLKQLQELPADTRAPEMATMKISRHGGWSRFFSSHPPLEDRIAALK